jgi:hypothetical protein
MDKENIYQINKSTTTTFRAFVYFFLIQNNN